MSRRAFATRFALRASIAILALIAGSTAANASQVFPTNPPVAVAFHGSTYFVGGTGGFAGLYRSDGTLPGTTLVKHVSAPAGLVHWGLTVEGDHLAFSSYDGYRAPARHFVSDGTTAGTRRTRSGPPGLPGRLIARMTDGGRFVVRSGRSDRLWYVPASPGAAPVDLAPIGDGGLAYGALDRSLYFVGVDADHGAEPWVSDGTPAGTHVVADLNRGSGASNFESATPAGNTFPEAFVPAGDVMYVLAGRPDGASNVPDTPYLLTGPAPGAPVTIDGAPAVVPLAGQSRGTPEALWFEAGTGPAAARYRVAAGGTVAERTAGAGFDEHGTLLVPGIRMFASGNTLRSTDERGTTTTLATTGLAAPSKSGVEPAINLLTPVGDETWFMAPAVDNGPWVLWHSDGTPAGSGPVVLPGQIDPVDSTLTAEVATKRDPRAPYRWRLSGSVAPLGIVASTASQLCRGTVSLRVTAYRSSRPLTRLRARVHWTGSRCEYARTITAPRSATHGRRGRLAVAVQFDGTSHVLPQRHVERIGLRYGEGRDGTAPGAPAAARAARRRP